MPKVSVIIPVYNAKEYLHRCLDSVCNQTLKDIEIICVDDCSTDNSYEILQEYANKYSNLKAIHLEKNGGESVARNAGLEIVKGEYIGFVDNDDKIDLDFYEKLYAKAKDENADIAKGETIEIGYNGEINLGSINKEIRENDNNLLFFTYHWWTAIYKHSTIKENAINFIEGYSLGGDVLFLNEFLLKARSITLVDNALYHYYRREDSGFSKILSYEKIVSALDIHGKIVENTSKVYPNTLGESYIHKWCLVVCFAYIFQAEEERSLRYCIDKAFEIYKHINLISPIKEEIEAEYPLQLEYLKLNDSIGLIEFYKKNNTRSKLLCSNLRNRIVRK